MRKIFLIPPDVLQNSSDPPHHLIIKAAKLVSVFEAEIDHPSGLLKVNAGNLKEYLKTFEWFCFSLKYKSFVKFSKHKIFTVSNFSEFLKDFLQA